MLVEIYDSNELLKRIQKENPDSRPNVTLIAFFPIHGGESCDEVVSVKNYNGFQRMEVQFVFFFYLFYSYLFKAFVLALNELNGRSDSEVFISALIYDSCSDSLAQHVRTLTNCDVSVSV